MADAGGLDLNQNFTRLGAFEIHLHHFQRFARLNGDGGTGTHNDCLPVCFFPTLRQLQRVFNCALVTALLNI